MLLFVIKRRCTGIVLHEIKRFLCSLPLQVTLSIELNDSQVDEFQRMIPVQLAQPPWNYTKALSKGITVGLRVI